MPVSEERLTELLDGEEPDYSGAAAEVGIDGLVLLAARVQSADANVASRAASLVGAIGRDPISALAAVPVLATALGHPDPGVRATAAHGASTIGLAAVPVLVASLADPEFGVRQMALAALSTPLPAGLSEAVKALAEADPVSMIRNRAAALVPVGEVGFEIGGSGLGDELVGAALDYARKRLLELRDAILGDVTGFANAVGVAGFADAGGIVATQLGTARAELDLVIPSLTAGDFSGAATHLGTMINAVRQAVAAVPGAKELRELLLTRINWGAGQPSGILKQLGLSGTAPDLNLTGGVLTYRITAPGTTVPAPVPFSFATAELSASLRLDGATPALSVGMALNGLEIGVGSGAIGSLLGGAGGSAQADVVFRLDTVSGLSLGGGSSTRVVVPARAKGGPLDLREVVLELPRGVPNTIHIGSTISVDLGGVITATVDGAGVAVRIDPATATTGTSPISITPKEPTGIGLLMDTGFVRGGGFLSVRPGGYGGALQLKLGPIEVKAVGLLTLDPDFALVVVMSIEFSPPIDLSFGFTLNAVGGVIGIEHRLDADALRAGFSDGALDHILFPVDPVAAAPAILSTLEQVFPVDPGSIVIGPMVEVGWGRPVSFLTAQLGVILSLPDPLIVIIGRVRIALPAPDLPIIDLRATVYGEITPEHLLIRVSLNGSRIAGFTVGGDIGFLLSWGGSAEFAISAGGFHPRYDPPRELAGMQRLSMDLSPPAILTLRAESYFALTTNSVQLGSHVEMGADLGVADISGYFTFDALIIFSPHFGFMVDLAIGLTVRVFGVTLLGVHIELHVSGTSPWRAEGSAEVEVLWCSVDVDVGPFTWGDDNNPPPQPADPRRLVFDALNHNPGAWQALAPPGADRVVRLKPALPSETEVTVHPMGLFDVRQHAIPLETVITRVGPNPVPVGQQRVHLGVPLVDSTPAGALSEVKDLFSAGNFLDLKDDEKLSRPSFEQMPAGARIRPPGEKANFDASLEAQLRYETFVCDEDGVIGAHSAPMFDKLLASSPRTALAAGAAGRTELRAAQRYATVPDPIVLADSGDVLTVSKATVTAANPRTVTYTHAAEQVLATDQQLARLGVA